MNLLNENSIRHINFGQKYGLIKVTKEIIKILNLCKNNNIKLIDTAINYGDTETELGKYDLVFLKYVQNYQNYFSKERC